MDLELTSDVFKSMTLKDRFERAKWLWANRHIPNVYPYLNKLLNQSNWIDLYSPLVVMVIEVNYYDPERIKRYVSH